MIILDTNVLSALMMPDLNSAVVAWLDKSPKATVWTTAVNIFESRSGIGLLPEGRRRRNLNEKLDAFCDELFPGRILPFDKLAAEYAAEVAAMHSKSGLNVGSRDTQIAGIALANGASIATRNTKDFDGLGIPLVNPWAI